MFSYNIYVAINIISYHKYIFIYIHQLIVNVWFTLVVLIMDIRDSLMKGIAT